MLKSQDEIAVARAAFIVVCLSSMPDEISRFAEDPPLNWLIGRRLEKDPDDRFSAERRAISKALQDYPDRKRAHALMAVNEIISETRIGFLKQHLGRPDPGDHSFD